ncbi:rRNA adenine N-6-methyltransferase family protein [Methanobrevibacter curvatus]|uniref:Ribosomal protein L11 methyltransferase n=1 Tax=Methanobrevibacter curvatus TaxID=49547 RepID=A0A166B0B5_9EURY|nr:rRNA adenine N-6-methyltransferase family protein [Methanobrevibacter curvatus]KZX12701.1 ribosomal protein L11 methyltransferase [Methanobrevibacter curvatus]
MKFKTNSYHNNLLMDVERIAFFQEALDILNSRKKKINIAYDLGSGSGILASLASKISKKVIAIEKDHLICKMARTNLKSLDNVEFIWEDVLKYKFNQKADLIICEALDTGLIDEEEVLILNHAINSLNDDGIIIPDSVINIIEPVNMDHPLIHYEDVEYSISNIDTNESNKKQYNLKINKSKYKHKILGNYKLLNSINFYKLNDPKVNEKIKFKINTNGCFNGLKIRTFTVFNNQLIISQTPMLNPPLFIPIDEIEVKKGDEIKVNIKYQMGGGLETIDVSYNGDYNE